MGLIECKADRDAIDELTSLLEKAVDSLNRIAFALERQCASATNVKQGEGEDLPFHIDPNE